jgi:hypothetical protein
MAVQQVGLCVRVARCSEQPSPESFESFLAGCCTSYLQVVCPVPVRAWRFATAFFPYFNHFLALAPFGNRCSEYGHDLFFSRVASVGLVLSWTGLSVVSRQ